MMRCFAAAGEGLSVDMVDDFCLWRGEGTAWRWRCLVLESVFIAEERVP